MKKIFVLSLTVLALLFCSESKAQSAAAVQKSIEKANIQFVKWFNSGKADSIVMQYHENACITDRGCGKEFLKTYYTAETGKYTFKALTTQNVTVKDDLATETGQWKIKLSSGSELSGQYRTEWQRVNNRWMILKETVL